MLIVVIITMRFSKLASKLNKKLRAKRGMSLGETLCAIIILLLATGGMAGGIQFATQEFSKSMIQSESKVLYSTLQSAIKNELEYISVAPATDRVYTTIDGDSGFATVGSYQIGDNSCKLTHNEDGFLVSEELSTLDTRLLVNKGVYSQGAYGFSADVKTYYNPVGKYFRINLKIYQGSNTEPVINGYFDVFGINL